jgi:FlaA1/EpsC-like NDP-sugar epimerase
LKRTLFYLTGDTLSILGSALLVVCAGSGLPVSAMLSAAVCPLVLIAITFELALNSLLSVYRLKWSTYSLADIPRSCIGGLVTSLLLLVLIVLGTRFRVVSPSLSSSISLGMLFTWSLANLFGSVALRSSKRFYLEVLRPRRGRRALLVACSEKSYFLLDALRRLPWTGYELVGFVDPEPVNRGIVSQGLPVLGTLDEIEPIIRRHRIQTVLVLLSSNGLPHRASGPPSLSQFYQRLNAIEGLEIRTIPSVVDLIQDRADIGALDRLTIHELTGRPPVTVAPLKMQQTFGDRRVMVTGAGGSIGSELCRQLARFRPSELILFERDDSNLFYIERELVTSHPQLRITPFLGDIVREEDVRHVFGTYHPQIVFHAAAYKHVPILEFHPDDAIRANVLGTHTVARAAAKYGTQCFVYISTDKAVNPTSVMGASKRIGEMVVTSMNGLGDVRFIAVRFGNVLDSRGSVTTLFRDAISKRQAITITHPDMKRYFMLASEAALLVMQAVLLAQEPATNNQQLNGGEVFVLDMGNPVRIKDLALTMIRRAGLKPDADIPIVVTGLRPGEKLSEELMTAEEGAIATEHERVFRARISRDYCYPDVLESLKVLEQSLPNSDPAHLRRLIQRIVSNYVPDPTALSVNPTAGRGGCTCAPAGTPRPGAPAPTDRPRRELAPASTGCVCAPGSAEPQLPARPIPAYSGIARKE